LPFVQGPVEIHIGNNVKIGGNFSVSSGYVSEETPQLVCHDRCEFGWNVQLTVNKEIVVEEGARISYDCRISDSDGHPRQTDLRMAGLPANPKDSRSVRICRGAWIGNGSHIMKGVTIGEGAVIGANSVVISDVPDYALALGNPAQVLIRGFGKPSTARKAALPQADQSEQEKAVIASDPS
jgi:acetyltransferase-like isoleucine patch superfamily enzyme